MRKFKVGAMAMASLVVVLTSTLSFGPAASAMPVLQYSQDGQNFLPISMLSSSVKASDYYNYSSRAGHPAFGVRKNTDTVSLYWDTTHDSLSLIFISGGRDHDRASGTVSVKGLPLASQLTLSDDPRKFKFSRKTDTLTGHYAYRNSTDGFVISGLESATFAATLNLSKTHGIENLRLTVGDPSNGGTFQTLDLRGPLYFRTAVAAPAPVIPIVGTAVPEPTGLPLLGLFAVLFSRRSRGAPFPQS